MILTQEALTTYTVSQLNTFRNVVGSSFFNKTHPHELLKMYGMYYLTHAGQIYVGDGAHAEIALEDRIMDHTVPDKGSIRAGYYKANPSEENYAARWAPALMVVQFTDKGSLPGNGEFEMTKRAIYPLLPQIAGLQLLRARVNNRESPVEEVYPLMF